MPDGSTGLAGLDAAVVWAGALVALAGGLGLLWRGTRGLRRILHRADQFWDDWQGTPPRPGVPGHPGVMARLSAIEHELHPNSGASLRDAVNRIEAGISPTAEK
ncbi:hypothetical protein [Kitasatospora sp. McL0602]|uniref:hypothetical protein n=1 Tax=Kitasatospora sp. McL0602 TaxID=3439530 RepID=UPI003F8AA578